jgi:putative ABC transport system permease protein
MKQMLATMSLKITVEELEDESIGRPALINYIKTANETMISTMYSLARPTTSNTYDGNLEKFGKVDYDSPSSISFYVASFEAKEELKQKIEDYNHFVESSEEYGKKYMIGYTDYVGLMMSSVTTIIDAISYVLIAFVSVSLVVSSIMIGIITYISVLERTKEIGVLRSIGASKKDIKNVFTAESLIIGLISGLIGIGVTVLLNIPINLIIDALAGIGSVAALPVAGAIILVLLSCFLTYIAGLIPANVASKKDPVTCLRSE